MLTTLRRSPKLIVITMILLFCILLSNCAPTGTPAAPEAAPTAPAAEQVSFQLIPTNELTTASPSAYTHLLVRASSLPAAVLDSLNQGEVLTTTLAVVPRTVFNDHNVPEPNDALALIASDSPLQDPASSNRLVIEQAAVVEATGPILLETTTTVSSTTGLVYEFTSRAGDVEYAATRLEFSPVGAGEDPAPLCGCRIWVWCICVTADLLPAGFELTEEFTLPHELTVPAGYKLPEDFSLPTGCDITQSCELPEGAKVPAGFVLPENYVLPHDAERPEGIEPVIEE